MSTSLFAQTFMRTTLELVRDYGRNEYQGYSLYAWVLDDRHARRRAEKALSAWGVSARIRSAYKPLVNFVMEELPTVDLAGVTIKYPELPDAPRRFLLEAYPAGALLGDVPVSWEAFSPDDEKTLVYRVAATRSTGAVDHYTVEAPNKTHKDVIGQPQRSPCGWLRLVSAQGRVTDKALNTEYEQIYDAAIATLQATDWKGEPPYFEELNFSLELPATDTPVDYGHETISLAEAMHEDLYFSALEFFQKLAGLPLGDRSLKPGQIVPDIRITDGSEARLHIRLLPLNSRNPKRPRVEQLATAPHTLAAQQISELVAELGGESLHSRSRAGRVVEARYKAGTDRPVMISAAQHANETSGLVGALRAAQSLAQQEESHFVISPLENPDGYAVQGRLTETQPHHMHHAARYTAFGNDLESQPRGGPFEHAIREQAFQRSGAKLHLNLHGYPAHEWTRPSTGYIPRGFEMWTIPKGFFLVVRYHSGWRDAAMALLDQVTQRLSQVPGLADFNRRLIELFEIHAGELTFPIRHGFPFVASEDNQQLAPLMLITEYPDETLTGDAFVQAHTAQMHTVLSAYEVFQTLALPVGH
ncbi:peptidase M14 [Natronospirillum operosum]|uniref:peptidase M14 n=1 Tax=Natronospirillum operosum TaxID=2759953 RepID=UPI001F0D9307|nr:peptidase M14 [Natronospirillum operosum]